MSVALESRGLGMQHILIIEKDMERAPIDMPNFKQKWGNLAHYKYLVANMQNYFAVDEGFLFTVPQSGFFISQPLKISTSLPLL